MAQDYEIQTVADGSTFTPARRIAAAARLCGVTPKQQAEHDAATLNAECSEAAYRAVRVREVA